MIDAMRYFEHQMNEKGYPNIEAIVASMTFIRRWLFLQKHYAGGLQSMIQAMDDAGGLVPDAWVSFIKEEFATRLSGEAGTPTLHSVFKNIFKLSPGQVKPPRIRFLSSAGGSGDPDNEDDDDDDDDNGDESKPSYMSNEKDKGKEKDPDEAHYFRAAIAQGIRYRSNRKARGAIESGSFLLAIDDPFDVLNDLHSQVESKREAERYGAALVN